MNGFYAENNDLQKFPRPGGGPGLVCELTLPAGEYLVWAKLELAISHSNPQQAGGGQAALAFDTAHDVALVPLHLDTGAHIKTIALMLAAKTGRAHRARLYFTEAYGTPTYISHARIMALKVDGLEETRVGADWDRVPDDEQEKLRDAILRAKLTDRGSIKLPDP